MSSKNRNAADAGARFWADMSARIDAEENANKKTDNFDVIEFAKGLYIKWDNEAQAAKKANPLEVLAERNREARSREKEAQQMSEMQEPVNMGLIKLMKEFQNNYFHG